MQGYSLGLFFRSARRQGAADSIATRIPPSPLGGLEDRRTAGPEDWHFPTTLEVLGRPKHIKFVANRMAGGLQDWRIASVGSIGGIERKTSLQRRILRSRGGLLKSFLEINRTRRIILGFHGGSYGALRGS